MALLKEIKDRINADMTTSDQASYKTKGSIQAYTDTKTRDSNEKDYYDSKWLKDRFSGNEIELLKKEFGITSDSALKAKVERMNDYDLDVLLNKLKNPGTTAYPGYTKPDEKPTKKPAETTSSAGLNDNDNSFAEEAIGGMFDDEKEDLNFPDYNVYSSENPFSTFTNKTNNTVSSFDTLASLLGINSIGDLFGNASNNKIPDLEQHKYNLRDLYANQDKLQDNSFWEANPELYDLALEKMAQMRAEKLKAREEEDKFNQDLENRIPGWTDMPSYEQKQMKDSIEKMNERLTTFPDEFISLYEQWKDLKTQSNTYNKNIIESEAKLEELQNELENTKSFKKFVKAFGELKFDFNKLPTVVIDIIRLSYYTAEFLALKNVPSQVIAEAIASAGYDFTDFLDASSLKKYLNKKWTIENEIHQLEIGIKNSRSNNSDISSANIGNHFSHNTIRSLENKMERKYPGMKARYEKYLKGTG